VEVNGQRVYSRCAAESAFANLAEGGTDALLSQTGLFIFAAPLLLEALHGGQKPVGFRPSK
jgi:hypothetical protein